MQEKKGSEKREVLLISFSISARFVFAIIDTAKMFGVDRKFGVKPKDEYTVSSGVIFLQSDYKLWHNLLNAQEVDIWYEDSWFPIIVTKQNYERSFNRSILKAIEFTFKMADVEHNNLI